MHVFLISKIKFFFGNAQAYWLASNISKLVSFYFNFTASKLYFLRIQFRLVRFVKKCNFFTIIKWQVLNTNFYFSLGVFRAFVWCGLRWLSKSLKHFCNCVQSNTLCKMEIQSLFPFQIFKLLAFSWSCLKVWGF